MANWIQVLEKQPSNQPCFPNKFKLKAFQKIFQPKIADRTQTATIPITAQRVHTAQL
jgi:putative Ca2+/H+ antiporter (TMEM165/GDT1 family)